MIYVFITGLVNTEDDIPVKSCNYWCDDCVPESTPIMFWREAYFKVYEDNYAR